VRSDSCAQLRSVQNVCPPLQERQSDSGRLKSGGDEDWPFKAPERSPLH
jgi:hypothetical protein